MSVRLIQQECDFLQGSYLEIPLFYPSFNDSGVLVPTDITGAVISLVVRKTATCTKFFSMDTTDYIQITDAVNGLFKIVINSEFSALLKERVAGLYKGHVEVYLDGEAIRTHCLTIHYSPEFNY